MDSSRAGDDHGIVVLTATAVETWAARWVLGPERVRRVGVALRRLPARLDAGTLVVCGLAGGLVSNLKPGAVIVPPWVGLPSGRRLACDRAVAAALLEAARGLGLEAHDLPLATSRRLVTGPDRSRLAAAGFAACDMETGLLIDHGIPVAAVRVILDAPEREISAAWSDPRNALRSPRMWMDTVRLGPAAVRYSLRAARVVSAMQALPSA